jgi:CelD/BcsL family acetyltransferase involved in cellulose biosynthesis
MLNAAVLDTWADFDALVPEWNALLERSRANTIFLTWEWIDAWRTTAGGHATPFIVAVRNDRGELVGLAPLYRTKTALAGVVAYNALRALGDYPTGAEYADLIVRSDCAVEASNAIVTALGSMRDRWDCIWLRNVAGWTGATDAITSACEHGRLIWRLRPREFACTPLPESLELYRQSLSTNKRQGLKSELKRILSRPTVKLFRCTSKEELPRLLDALFDLHHKRRRLLGDDGSFHRRPAEAAFYRRFAPVAAERGWLDLYALEDEGDIKAVQFAYRYANVLLQMQEGFDPDYFKGAGNVLRMHVIERSIAEKVTSLDFLGTMSEHKRRWRAELRLGSDVFIGTPSVTNRLLFTPPIWPRGLLRTLRREPLAADLSGSTTCKGHVKLA